MMIIQFINILNEIKKKKKRYYSLFNYILHIKLFFIIIKKRKGEVFSFFISSLSTN